MYKIMLADDEGIVIDSLKFIIEKEFKDICEVQYAKTGRSVIELAESFRPDIAVMDIQMPVMNGYEAAKRIRESGMERIGELPIIAMTADAFAEDVKRARLSGMDGHLAKPITIDQLRRALSRCAAWKERNQDENAGE